MKKIFIVLGVLFLMTLITLVSAAIYQEPWIQNQLGDNHNLSDMDYITANYLVGDGSGITGTTADSMNWTGLTNYPVACPGSGAITQLNDSVTCSDLWVDVAGDTMTGNLTFSETGLLNSSYIESLDWTNISITESQITDLQTYISNDTNVDLLNINASSMDLHGDLNMTDGNLTLMDKITFRLGEVIDNLVDGLITITGNLNVTGNVTAENIPLSAYYRNGGNDTIPVATGSEWVNITFQKKEAGLQVGFTHDHTAADNFTHIADDGGIYDIHYMASIVDSAANPNSRVAVRLAYENGTLIKGSYAEGSSSKQNAEFVITYGFLADIEGGVPFIVQFTGNETSVSLQTYTSFVTGGSSIKLSMHRIE